jgi:hypothetical protein
MSSRRKPGSINSVASDMGSMPNFRDYGFRLSPE